MRAKKLYNPDNSCLIGENSPSYLCCMVIVFASLLPMSKAKVRESSDWISAGTDPGFHPNGDVEFMGMEIYFNCIFAIFKFKN